MDKLISAYIVHTLGIYDSNVLNMYFFEHYHYHFFYKISIRHLRHDFRPLEIMHIKPFVFFFKSRKTVLLLALYNVNGYINMDVSIYVNIAVFSVRRVTCAPTCWTGRQ